MGYATSGEDTSPSQVDALKQLETVGKTTVNTRVIQDPATFELPGA